MDNHCIYYHVPSLLGNFDTTHINALTAPRALVRQRRPRLLTVLGLGRIDAVLKTVYAK